MKKSSVNAMDPSGYPCFTNEQYTPKNKALQFRTKLHQKFLNDNL